MMARRWTSLAADLTLLGITCWTAVAAHADCTVLPSIVSTNTFLQNFANPCYAFTLSNGNGTGSLAGDLNATYNELFYNVNPRYQVVLVGSFPNSRFFSLTLDDDHQATVATLNDFQILPYSPSDVNPFLPGQSFVSSQTYISVGTMGGGQSAVPQAGCVIDTTRANVFDMAQRHRGLSWNSNAAAVAQLGPHEEGVPNTGGYLMIRRYVELASDKVASTPYAIARDTTTGCAVPLSIAYNQVMTETPSVANGWLHVQQTAAHNTYDTQYHKPLCWGTDADTAAQWYRGGDFVAGDNPAAGYIAAALPASVPVLSAQNRFIRARFRLPHMPNTPCISGCSLTGSEELRYLSLSFMAGPDTVGTISDMNLIPDSQGYVTLIVGVGAAQPPQVTSANGYTWFDLAGAPRLVNLANVTMRYMLPAASFRCSSFTVPTHTGEHTLVGGYMGEYIPAIDFPDSTQIPANAYPLVRPNTCSQLPAGPAPICSL